MMFSRGEPECSLVVRVMNRIPFLLCAILLATPCLGQEGEPAPLVEGRSVAVDPGVVDLKIVNAQWPDATSLARFGRDAARIEGADTYAEKAIAIWRWARRCTMFTGSGTPCEPGRGHFSEPNRVLNIYGAHHCDGLSRLTATLWRESQGLPAMKLYRSGHTMSDLWWVDDDGVGRYHMFDNNYGYFLFDRSGKHIVAAGDIGIDFSLAHFPSRTLAPWIEKQYWMWAWCHVQWPEPDPYDGTMALRRGEGVELLWGNVGRPYHANMMPARPDPDGGPYPMTYGNSLWTLSEDFGTERWTGRLAVPPAGAKVRDGKLVQAEASKPAVLVYRFRLPHVVADVDLSARASEGGTVAIETSVDGGRTWRPAWQLSREARGGKTLKLSDVQPKFDTPAEEKRGRPSRTTPLGRYDFLLRVTLADDAELDELGVSVVAQQNLLTLPTLVPGVNRITLSGDLGERATLEVTYVFDDADAKGKRHVVRATSLPYTYEIAASGRRWNDVVCRRIEARIVPTDEEGNLVVTRPADPKVTPPNGRAETLDWRVLNAIVPEAPAGVQEYAGVAPMTDAEVWKLAYRKPELKPAADCIRDLASDDLDTRRLAAAALMVHRDPAACDALEKLAVEDTTVAKYYALQALYWTDAKRAWPVMAKILKRDESIRFAPDTRGRTEAPTCLNTCALAAALAGHGMIAEAVPLIEQAIVRESQWWFEPQWAMVRALGQIGDPAAVGAVRRHIRGGRGDTRVVAIRAAVALGDKGAVPLIAPYLKIRGWNILPETALWALGELGTDGADYTGDILPHLESERTDRRWLAAEALAVVGDPARSLPAVRAALEKETFAFGRARMEAAVAALEKRQATDGK